MRPAYTLGDLSAYDRPDEWLRYLQWAFGLDFDQTGGLVSSRELEIVGSPETGVYARLQAPVRMIGGLAPFSSWLAGTGR